VWCSGPAVPDGERHLEPCRIVLSCEHGGNRLPRAWRASFVGAETALGSHRGWDPGALALARGLAKRLDAPLFATRVSRLLVDANRSLGHPRLFSEFTQSLPRVERARILERHWRPHRERVLEELRRGLGHHPLVLHVSVHSFTPVLDGSPRTVDVGVLYDPARERERSLCRAWIAGLRHALPTLRIRANAPYRGVSDGFTTHLRRVLGDGYLGVELEVSQALLVGRRTGVRRLADAHGDALSHALATLGARRAGNGHPAKGAPPLFP